MPAPDKWVLASMAKFAHHDATNSYPAVKTLAAISSLAHRTVQVILKRLEASHFIRCVGVKESGCRNYTLTLDSGKAELLNADRNRRSKLSKRKEANRKPQHGGAHGAPPAHGAPMHDVREGDAPGDVKGVHLTVERGAHGAPESIRINKPIENGIYDAARLSTRSSSSTLTDQQRRYSDVGKLAEAAITLSISNESRPTYTRADWKQDLKDFAAQRGINYSDKRKGCDDIIERALEIAERRQRAKNASIENKGLRANG